MMPWQAREALLQARDREDLIEYGGVDDLRATRC